MKQILLVLGIYVCISAGAQNVGVGTTSPSAKLDISSTNSGVLIPRVALTATSSASPVSSPVTSMLVYNTATAGAGATAVTPGFYYWDGGSSAWIRLIDNVAASNNIYNTDGTLTGNRTVTQGADNITFSSTTGNFNYNTSGIGNVSMGSVLTNTGSNAFATGNSNTVSGSNSFVTGNTNTVSGNNAFVSGQTNNATGIYTFISGTSNTVSGSNAFATGNGNNVSGNTALVAGKNNTVSALYSMVSGLGNKDNGTDDVVGGTNNYVTTGYGHSLVVGATDTVTGSAGAVFGFLNKITNFEAFAQGDRNTASGQASAVFGGSNTASGSNAFVTGQNNTGAGTAVLMSGNGNSSAGNYNMVGGNGNSSAGSSNMVGGSSNTAAGTSSLVSGISNKDNGTDNVVGGTNNYVTTGFGHSIVVGNTDTVTASAGAAFGFLNKITAFEAFAQGDRNTASGTSSAVFGGSNTASGSNAFVTGQSNTSSGIASLVSGNGNTVSGNYTLVSGNGNNAAGSFSTVLNNSNSSTSAATTSIAGGFNSQAANNLGVAIGWADTASGVVSMAVGRNNNAPSFAEYVGGTFATNYTPTSTSAISATDRLFNIGNGTNATTRADAFTILKNGNVGINNASPAQKLDVAGTTKTTNLQMTSGAALGSVMVSDATGNGTWTSPATVLAAFGTGTQNYITKWNNAGGTTIGNSQIFDNGTNVGIGSSSPAATLDINGPVRVQGAQTTHSQGVNIEWNKNSGDGSTWILNQKGLGSGGFTFGEVSTANAVTTRMLIDGSGNVGIGTTSPNGKLAVVGKVVIGDNTVTNNDPNDNLYLERVGTYTQMHIFNNDGVNPDINAYLSENTTGNGSGFGNNNPGLNLWTASAHPIRFATNAAERLTILSGGNVGISNTNPAYPLDVTGVINASTGFKVAGGTPSTSTYLKGDGTNFVAGTIQAADVPSLSGTYVDLTSAQTAAGIKTWSNNAIFNGNVGIGTSAIPKGAIGFAKLAADGTVSSSAGPHVQYTTSSDNYPVYQQLNWSHDNVAMTFDGYYDGAWKSGGTGGSFQFYKVGGAMNLNYSSVATAGSAASFQAGWTLLSNGAMGIANGAPGANLLNVSNPSAAAASTTGFGINLAAQTGGTNAYGGAVNISAGQGGNPSGGFPAGGSVLIQAGAGGTSGTSGTTGGSVTIAANGSSYCGGCGLTGGSVNIYSGGPISGSGITPGDINFYSGYATPTQRMIIKGSNGNVGIGTASPTTAKLVISGSAGAEGIDLASTDQYANLRVIRNSLNAGDHDMFIGYQSGNTSTLHLYSNNAETMTVSAGKVGVGTSSPGATLDVVGTTRVGGTNGVAIKAMQVGQNTIGAGSSGMSYTLTFPATFANIPKVIATCQTQIGQTYPDNFSVIVQSVTTTNCVLRIQRTDATTSWGQTLLVNWFAFDN